MMSLLWMIFGILCIPFIYQSITVHAQQQQQLPAIMDKCRQGLISSDTNTTDGYITLYEYEVFVNERYYKNCAEKLLSQNQLHNGRPLHYWRVIPVYKKVPLSIRYPNVVYHSIIHVLVYTPLISRMVIIVTIVFQYSIRRNMIGYSESVVRRIPLPSMINVIPFHRLWHRQPQITTITTLILAARFPYLPMRTNVPTQS